MYSFSTRTILVLFIMQMVDNPIAYIIAFILLVTLTISLLKQRKNKKANCKADSKRYQKQYNPDTAVRTIVIITIVWMILFGGNMWFTGLS